MRSKHMPIPLRPHVPLLHKSLLLACLPGLHCPHPLQDQVWLVPFLEIGENQGSVTRDGLPGKSFILPALNIYGHLIIITPLFPNENQDRCR